MVSNVPRGSRDIFWSPGASVVSHGAQGVPWYLLVPRGPVVSCGLSMCVSSFNVNLQQYCGTVIDQPFIKCRRGPAVLPQCNRLRCRVLLYSRYRNRSSFGNTAVVPGQGVRWCRIFCDLPIIYTTAVFTTKLLCILPRIILVCMILRILGASHWLRRTCLHHASLVRGTAAGRPSRSGR